MKWLRDRMGWQTEQEEWGKSDWEPVEVEVAKPVLAVRRGENIATYNLQVFAPEIRDEIPVREPMHRETEADKRVLADLPAMLELVEEQLEGLLPDGYQVRITEWNK